MKIAICNELFKGWSIETVFQYTAQLGYDGVEVAPYTLADSVTEISPKRRTEIRRAAEESRIEIAGLHWLLGRPEGLHICHPDEIIRKRTQVYMKALIHFCADLGGKFLIHGSSQQRTVKEGWDFKKSWDRARETFEACLETAQEMNVTYCVEPLERAKTNLFNNVEEAIRLVKEINHPHFRMMVDCRSASAEEKSVPEALIRALKSGHLRHVHVNDTNGMAPGFGKLTFSPILKTLIENNYEGYISVEASPPFEFDAQTITGRSIGYLRGILETLEER
jgi:D-psicose/D-tagatose/L-ribulose 3-epimerase